MPGNLGNSAFVVPRFCFYDAAAVSFAKQGEIRFERLLSMACITLGEVKDRHLNRFDPRLPIRVQHIRWEVRKFSPGRERRCMVAHPFDKLVSTFEVETIRGASDLGPELGRENNTAVVDQRRKDLMPIPVRD